MRQEDAAQVAPRLLEGLGRWAARARLLSPGAMAERLRLDASAAVVGGQIMACLENSDNSSYADAALVATWASYGAESFKAALEQRVWCAIGLEKEATAQQLISPAEALSMLGDPAWVERLRDMVPAKMWGRRTQATMAWGWEGDIARLGKMGLEIKSVGPLLRMCANSAVDGSAWERTFAALWDKLDTPSQMEELACRALLMEGKRGRMEQFVSWMEDRQMRAEVCEPAQKSARQPRRM